MDNEKAIKALRKVFAVSVATFDMQRTTSMAFGGNPERSNLHKLHLAAKRELEKETPDMEKIDEYIELMQKEVEKLKDNSLYL